LEPLHGKGFSTSEEVNAMEDQRTRMMPTLLSEPCIYIENGLAKLTATYQASMLESSRTESDLVAEYLVANADEVLDLKARARALSGEEAEAWLGIIRQRISKIVYMRRPR
jgi:hypothetical protein